MSLLELKPSTTQTESTESSGTFVIEPLMSGFGQTIGNSLRRVLLSHLTGAAVTKVRIEGASHEFSTIPGVKEDVIELLVNLKHIPVRCHSSAVTTLRLEIRGLKRLQLRISNRTAKWNFRILMHIYALLTMAPP